MTINLKDLPEITFADPDVAEVERQLFSTYELTTGRKLYPGNPERLFLDTLAVEISRLLFVIDYTGKQNLLAYSRGDNLAHLGAFYDCARLETCAADCTVRFEIDEPLDFEVFIDQGTRITDGELVFATQKTVIIAPGSLAVEVTALCQTTGKVGNGLLPGQLSGLVDPVAYLTGVSNITTTLGGADQEDDDRFRKRIRLACEAFSSCGPEGAYLFHTLSVSPTIIDAAAVSHEPGAVTVYPLCTDGELPRASIVAAVASALSNEKVRPLTDLVQVRPPETVNYDLAATWYLAESATGKAAVVAAAVETAKDKYLAWQRGALGRDIDPSELTVLIKQAGVKRVEVTQPAYTRLEAWQVAVPGTINIAFGGIEGA